jgi:hypothetical protein
MSKKFDLLGTPETSLRGLSTRIALRVLRSRPSSASLELSESPALSSELRMVMYLMTGGWLVREEEGK